MLIEREKHDGKIQRTQMFFYMEASALRSQGNNKDAQ